jgi:hypothetical protein
MNHHGLRTPRVSKEPGRAGDADRLAAANINSRTGLSTDYLNHFGEAIMLLDLASEAPEYRVELARWRPLTYHQYFAVSQLAHRGLSMAAYDQADAAARRQFDAICAAMVSVIMGARSALRREKGPLSATATTEAVQRLKALLARASAVVNGLESTPDASSCSADATTP